MAIDAMVLGRDMDGEGVASLLNMVKVTLSQGASAPNEAVRFQEFSAGMVNLQGQVDALVGAQHDINTVHVDTSSTTLAAALALGTYSAVTHSWTFGSKVINEGDVIILQSPTDLNDRAWIHTGGTAGTAADFVHLNSDVTALINAGTDAIMAAIRGGVPVAGDTLMKVYTLALGIQTALGAVETRLTTVEGDIVMLNTAVSGKADIAVTSITFTDANDDGIIEANVANPLGTHEVIPFVMKAGVGGVYAAVDGDAYDLKISDATLAFRTLSPSMLGQTYKVIVIGM